MRSTCTTDNVTNRFLNLMLSVFKYLHPVDRLIGHTLYWVHAQCPFATCTAKEWFGKRSGLLLLFSFMHVKQIVSSDYSQDCHRHMQCSCLSLMYSFDFKYIFLQILSLYTKVYMLFQISISFVLKTIT